MYRGGRKKVSGRAKGGDGSNCDSRSRVALKVGMLSPSS